MIYNVDKESNIKILNEHVQKLNEAIKYIDIENIKQQLTNKNIICNIDLNGNIGSKPKLDIKFLLGNTKIEYRYTFANKKPKLYLYSFYSTYYHVYPRNSNLALTFTTFERKCTRDDMIFILKCFEQINSWEDLEVADKKILSYIKTKNIEKDFK